VPPRVPLHPHQRPPDAKPEGPVVAGQRDERRPPCPPPGVRGHPLDALRVPRVRPPSRRTVDRDLRRRVRDRRRPHPRRVRALWLHLEDVYWSEEGRRSIDAVVIAGLLGGAIVFGASPVTREDTTSALTIMISLAIVVGISAIAALKGKYIAAVVGVPIPLVSLVAAIRLAEPDSPWARRRYPPGSRKLVRATARGKRHQARYRRWQD